MPTLFVNAVSAKAGGAVNDLVHTLPLLRRHLQEHGWSVRTWLVEAGRSALKDAGCPMDDIVCADVASPLKRAIWEFIRFPRLVREHKPAVVFHFSNFICRDLPVPQITVLRSAMFFSPMYATHQRRGIYQKLRYRLGRRLSRRTIHLAAEVFCVSDAQRREILAFTGSDAPKVPVAHLGVSAPAEALALQHCSRSDLLRRLPTHVRANLSALVQGDRAIFLNVGHYYIHRNLGLLLEAVDQLAERGAKISLLLTAGITGYQGPWTAQTRHEVDLARRLAAKGLLFDLDPVPEDCVWPLLAMADVFVFPSSVESFGHPLLEAMSMGVPVVASDTPIHREICGQAAVFHDVHDPNALAAAMANLLGSQQQRQELISAGKANATRFTWDAHVEKLASAIIRTGKCR